MSLKRARAESGVKVEGLRKFVIDSFKMKCMNMDNINNWKGFGSLKEKSQIEEGGITVKEGPNGLAIKLSEELKT
ncbi:hypothetical protein ACOSQ3_014500 [Xanthoceras sorbifolium]